MANLSGKQKKLITFGGAAAVCFLIIAVIIASLGGSGNPVQQSEVSNDGQSDVTVDGINVTPEPEASSDISIPKISGAEDKSTDDTVLNTDEENNVDVNLTESTKQPVVEDKEVLINPAQTPDGESTGGSPQAQDHNSVSTPDTSTSSGSPKHGDTKDGMIYVDGFGWIKNEGGGSSGGTVGEAGDELTGNQVGHMD